VALEKSCPCGFIELAGEPQRRRVVLGRRSMRAQLAGSVGRRKRELEHRIRVVRSGRVVRKPIRVASLASA
jgi:hypothetical protein